MSKTKQSETEKARLQGVWRAAAKTESGELFIPCPDLATARNLRFALYNAVRAERQQPGLADEALADALDRMQLGVTSSPAGVMIRQKAVLALTDELLATIPGLEELAKTSEQVHAEASAARMLKRLEAEAAPAAPIWHAADVFRDQPSPAPGASAANPFFTRDPANPGASS